MPALAPLIGAEALAHQLDQPGHVLVDCRFDLADPAAGISAYRRGHLPGAVYLHLEQDLSGPKNGRNGRHPLPDAAALMQCLGRHGISPASHVVAYDDAGGMFAARLWWLLRWLGHERVQVLDGGFQAWCEAAYPLEHDPPEISVQDYTATPDATRAVNAQFVEQRLGQDGMVLIDARSPQRFKGEGETLDPIGGHIPGAINHFFKHNLDEQGRFAPPEQLRERFEQLLGDRSPGHVVHSCGSGVTACHNLLAMEVAGLTGSRLYPGSWSEWCADPARPMVAP